MLPKRNPKKLNKLQLKTLAIMQEFAATDIAEDGENDGETLGDTEGDADGLPLGEVDGE